MEGRRGMEQEYYEFEMLLGEIPDATLVNPQQSDTSATNNSLMLGTVPKEQVEQKSLHYGKYINSHISPQHSKNGNQRTLFGSLNPSKGSFDQKGQGNVICDYSNLQDTCSLASAFDELSLSDVSTRKPDMLTSVMHDSASSFNQNFMSDKENALLNRFNLGMDCVGMPLSSCLVGQVGTMEMSTPSSLTILNGCYSSDPEVEAYSTLTRIDGVRKFSAKMDNQDSSEFLLKKRPEDLPGFFQGPQQNLAEYPGAMPMYPESHAFHLLSRVPSSRMELTSPAIQQQCYMNAQSTALHNLTQFNMDWQNPEGYHDEQIFYPPYIQNQGLQVRQIPNGAVSCVRSSTGNHIQPYFRYPGHHQTQHLSGTSCGNDNFVHKGCNDYEAIPVENSPYQFSPQNLYRDENCYGVSHGQKLASSDNLAYCTKDFLGSRFLERTKICPEKILTRSDGMNSRATLRSSFARMDQSPPISDNSWLLHSDGHAGHPINGYFQLDGLNCRSSSPNNFDFVITPKSWQMKYNSVDDIVGKIYSMAKDQIGCRFLQKKFTEGAPEDIEKIFDEIKSHIVELMTDPFGNYLVQKLLEVCNEDQRMCVLRTVTRKMGELFRISCDMHGTRAVQRVIETVQTAEQYSMIVASLKPFVVALIKNVNGNHVAQRCLQHFPAEYSEFVIGAAIAHCVELAADRQGCCVLQKCLHHSDGDQKNRLMSEIAANSLALSQDQYGNYVVQFMLDQEVPWVTSNILHQLEGSYADLSMQKCSSNVVEKCIRLAGEEMRIRIIQELICSPVLPQILQDPFGNYVIQTVLKECKGVLRAAVMENIRPHFTELRSNPFGKKVLSTILRK